MNYSSKFWLFAPLALLFALALWAAGHWYEATDALGKKLDQINGHEAMPGVTVSFATKSISGFPFNIDLVITGLEVKGQGAHGPFRWTSQNFALHRLTYGPVQDIFEAAGNQTLSWTDGHGDSHSVKFLPGSLRASTVGNATGLTRFDLDLVAAGGTDGDGKPFTVNRAQLHLRRDPKIDGLDLMISGDDITAQQDIAHLFGNHIKSLSIYATLTPGSPFSPLLAGTQSWSAAASAWHDRNGQVTLGPVAITSSGVNLSANSFADTSNDLRGALDPLF